MEARDEKRLLKPQRELQAVKLLFQDLAFIGLANKFELAVTRSQTVGTQKHFGFVYRRHFQYFEIVDDEDVVAVFFDEVGRRGHDQEARRLHSFQNKLLASLPEGGATTD